MDSDNFYYNEFKKDDNYYDFEDYLIKKAYDIIIYSGLFDINWYSNNYYDYKYSGLDPINHYLKKGCENGFNPFPSFNSSDYLKKFPNLVRKNINPLVHYIVYNNIVSDTFKEKSKKSRFIPKKSLISRGIVEIKNKELFDEKWYLDRYSDVKRAGVEPLAHYINHGAKENRNPSPFFDTKYYVENYPDVKNSGMNPLIHYALFGMDENRLCKPESKDYSVKDLQFFSSEQIDNILKSFDNQISIIIPIYNAYEETKSCVESILKNTHNLNYELILINDCSTDERISTFLNSISNRKNIRIIENSVNKGFVKTVNIGMKSTNNDVILLNSDTEVTPKWLQKILINAYSETNIATVTPLSNAASVFSVPKRNFNEIPSFLSVNDMANIVEKNSFHINLEVPTANGFCMFIKREVLNEIGFFDEEHFGKGYGEENEFSMRAISKGWKHIMDDSTYIFHKESASFLDNTSALKENNYKILCELYPEYPLKVRDLIDSPELSFIQNNVEENLHHSTINKKRILYVLHEDITNLNGTGYTNSDLIEGLNDEFECFILTSNSSKLTLWKKTNENVREIYSWKIEWDPMRFYDVNFRNIYFNIIYALNIDLIHIDHLINQSFDLPKIANILNIPTLLMCHDFYYICPSIQLLDANFKFCNAICKKEYHCRAKPLYHEKLPNNLQDFIDLWRLESSILFNYCNVLVGPSKSVINKYCEIFPKLKNKIHVIPHGRNFSDNPCKINKPSYYVNSNKPVKILVPGNIMPFKGSFFIKELIDLDIDNELEFHFMGDIPNFLKNKGIYHGHYNRENFKNMVNDIAPSFIGIFSIWPETFCHVLSEAWACKIPVIATNLGALKERIDQTGGGILVDYQSPENTYKSIINLINDESKYDEILNNIRDIPSKTIFEMGKDYSKIYNKLLGLY